MSNQDQRSGRARRIRRQRRVVPQETERRPQVIEEEIPVRELGSIAEAIEAQAVERPRRSRRDEAQVVSAGTLLAAFFEQLETGKSLVLTKVPEGIRVQEYAAFVEAKAAKKKSKRSKIGNEIFLSEEFVRHTAEWKALSKPEQRAMAADIGAQWEACETPRVDHMRMTRAVREALGIEKYKSGYRTQRARSDAKRRIEAGELEISDV